MVAGRLSVIILHLKIHQIKTKENGYAAVIAEQKDMYWNAVYYTENQKAAAVRVLKTDSKPFATI